MSFAASGMGATFLGPAGVLLSLGIESVVSNLTLVTQLYNYWAMFTITVLAVMTSQRDEKFMAVLLPLWAGLCMFFGWLKYPDMSSGFGIIVICAAIGIMNYMNVTRHEKYGIAGPGNQIIKIFTFLVVFQCIIGFVNMSNIFPSDVLPVASTNSQYTNIDLNTEMTTLNSAGGFGLDIFDIGTIFYNMMVAALKIFLTMIISVAAISVVLAASFPWLVQAGAIGVGFLVVLQFVIWIMYAFLIFQLFYKPTADPGW